MRPQENNSPAGSPLSLHEVTLTHAAPESFSILLQGGFDVAVPRPCTVREFLCELVGVCGDYAGKHIQTIFLNGRAIDDMDQALLVPSSRLALSAALPGLVGATLRRGGFYSRLREGITYHGGSDAGQERGPFRLEVRLFNAVGRDLAAIFLKYGVILSSERLQDFLSSRPETFFRHLGGAFPAGDRQPGPLPGVGLPGLPAGEVLLRVLPDA